MNFRLILLVLFIVSYCIAQSDSTVPFSINSYRPQFSTKRSLNLSPYFRYYNEMAKKDITIDTAGVLSDTNPAHGDGGITTDYLYRHQLSSSDLV